MAGEDFAYPATDGVRPEKSWLERQTSAFIADLMEMASRDAAVFSALAPVRSLHTHADDMLEDRSLQDVPAVSRPILCTCGKSWHHHHILARCPALLWKH